MTTRPAPGDLAEPPTPDARERLGVAEADPFGTDAMLICPVCLAPFTAPGDSTGGDIDCPACPWTGKVGESFT